MTSFTILQHASQAVDEVRRAEFFRKGGAARDLVRGKRWFLLSSWLTLDRGKRRQLNALFALNRRILKAYLLKESLSQLWNYTYEAAMLRYLQSWIDQLRWQRLKPMEQLARMLLDHLEGILNYCRTKGSRQALRLKEQIVHISITVNGGRPQVRYLPRIWILTQSLLTCCESTRRLLEARRGFSIG
jgi:transposase